MCRGRVYRLIRARWNSRGRFAPDGCCRCGRHRNRGSAIVWLLQIPVHAMTAGGSCNFSVYCLLSYSYCLIFNHCSMNLVNRVKKASDTTISAGHPSPMHCKYDEGHDFFLPAFQRYFYCTGCSWTDHSNILGNFLSTSFSSRTAVLSLLRIMQLSLVITLACNLVWIKRRTPNVCL